MESPHAAPAPPTLEVLAPLLRYPPERVAEKTRGIYEQMLRSSRNLHEGNFSRISGEDVGQLFELYDAGFFEGAITARLRAGGHGMTFRAAPRLTRVGGKTSCYRWPGRLDYEIAISSTLLFQSFADVEREVRINGLPCADRLEALQRIMEHEIIHLVEMLVWGKSSCSGKPFKALAHNIFAHTEFTHDLVTQRERALAKYSLRVGDAVTFEFEGKQYTGLLNRITRRATVLVEHPQGAPYSDGRRYQKFYVPLALLRKVTT